MDMVSLDDVRARDRQLVGGKAAALAALRDALPIPDAFCLTTAAHRRLHAPSAESDAELARLLATAYRQLDGGALAVRSSAVAEDQAEASYAGQLRSLLGVMDETALLEAVRSCWASLTARNAAAYRQRLGAEQGAPGMGVIVQRQVEALASGVLFTRDPRAPAGSEMLVEAADGAAAVVSGNSMPESVTLDRVSGSIVTRRAATGDAEPARRILTDSQLAELGSLGREIEGRRGAPQDIEWAWDGRQFWVLQARPITGAAGERERLRREEIAVLTAKAQPGGTVWSRCNLAESLPEATPMTWSVLGQLLSGRGGLGLMYADFGFRTDPQLEDEGCYDLICSRPYCNLSREPLLYAHGMPLEHDFAALKAEPRKALDPHARLHLRRAGLRFWMNVPMLMVHSVHIARRLHWLQRNFATTFRTHTLPKFEGEVRRGAAMNLKALSSEDLLGQLNFWIERTLRDFARDSLKPTVLATQAMGEIAGLLQPLEPERRRACVHELIASARPDPGADLAAGLRALACGRCTRAEFLERFGHRGPQEMELAEPRWAENPTLLDGLGTATDGKRDAADIATTCGRIADEARLHARARAALGRAVEAASVAIGLRETGRHYLMQGYALIRRLLLELDWRYRLRGGIFYLTLRELPLLVAGKDLSTLIAERRRRWTLALTLEAPPVIFSDDLEAIGRPVAACSSGRILQGVPLSAGVVEGPALVLDRPDKAVGPVGSSILVCQSTDPAWTPWLVQARGLVAEAGGVLSHGAIIARELGLPAVAGLPGIQQQLRSGQRLRVDGTAGTVELLPPTTATCH